MSNWAADALGFLAAGPAAMVTLAHVEGSAPREAGARMIVAPDAVAGTIGGGNLEFLLIDQARRLLRHGDVDVLQQDYPLGPLLAQCCGGRVRVLVERLDATSRTWLVECAAAERAAAPYVLEGAIHDGRIVRVFHPDPLHSPPGVSLFAPEGDYASSRGPWTRIVERISPAATSLVMFGAGHVGRAIAHIAVTLPFRLSWFDIRQEFADAPGAVIRDDLVAAVSEAPPNAFYLVLTHSHELDYQLVRAILQRRDAGYCGLIGSITKRKRFASRLARDGLDIANVACPIGQGAGVRSKHPSAIAVAACAELLSKLEASEVAPQVDEERARAC